ncbi:alpha/beta fold hydrolase [Parvularcula sp. ZS-1/3]|uniref:Alpha/beta fold hydrolase n=1 Tax=Parvularcula mediterranea TaxID=2732508 RepID=A0A7Y3RMN3_9PROT|nr:alpha/beta fold hydrolase [Parvularcula mediterranea]NNU16391.1 alpha/beta fold hydrolase [Parvularcula mediterranea]
MRNLFYLLIFVVVAACGREPEAAEGNRAATLEDYRGDWEGILSVMTQELPVNIHVTPDAGEQVTLDSPDQGLFGLAATEVEVFEGALRLEWETLGAAYVGRIDDAGEAINGEFSQGPITTELVFTRMDPAEAAALEEEAAAPTATRPQEPVEPFPYRTEEVSLATTDGVTLAGTLTHPEGEGPFPAIVLLSGSGAQDRDEALARHRPFFVLADRLTRAGIATVRFDDRGVGGSGGQYDNTEFDRLGDDAAEMLAMLRMREDIREAGFLGHSEGGMVAGVAASRGEKQPDFIVALASPFAPLTEAIIDQVAYGQRQAKVPEAIAEQNIALQRQLLDALTSADSREEGCDAAKAILEPFGAAAQAEPLCGIQRYSSFLVDIEADYTAYGGPVLALFGGKDIQVVAETHAPVAERALEGEEMSRVVVVPDANHLFQTAETGDLSEYGLIETTMEEDVMATIAEFVSEVTAQQ